VLHDLSMLDGKTDQLENNLPVVVRRHLIHFLHFTILFLLAC